MAVKLVVKNIGIPGVNAAKIVHRLPKTVLGCYYVNKEPNTYRLINYDRKIGICDF